MSDALIHITDGRYRGTLAGLSLHVLIFLNLWPDFNFLQPSVANQIQAMSKEYQNSSQVSWTVFNSDTQFTELQSELWWTYIAQNHNASFCSHIEAILWWLVNNDHYLQLLAPDWFSGSLDCWIFHPTAMYIIIQANKSSQSKEQLTKNTRKSNQKICLLSWSTTIHVMHNKGKFFSLTSVVSMCERYIHQEPQSLQSCSQDRINRTDPTKAPQGLPLSSILRLLIYSMTTQDGELFP
jgi:hypothetical protein